MVPEGFGFFQTEVATTKVPLRDEIQKPFLKNEI